MIAKQRRPFTDVHSQHKVEFRHLIIWPCSTGFDVLYQRANNRQSQQARKTECTP